MKATDFIKVFATDKAASSHKSTGIVASYFPRWHLLSISGLSAILLVGFVASSSSATEKDSRLSQALPLNLPTSQHQVDEKNTKPLQENITWRTEVAKSGDSLSTLFNRAGLSDTTLLFFLKNNPEGKKLTRIHPGQTIDFNIDKSGKLQRVRYQKNRLKYVEFTHSKKGFKTNTTVLKPDIKIAYRQANIINSLFLAGTHAGLEESLIMDLANIFGWDIDFALDIRANDSFKVLYEEQFINGEKIGNGAILAAEFINQNKAYKAVRYTDKKGNTSYYTPEGRSMKKAFLRTPVDFARISSHFNLKRKHPILNRIRAHKGTDYAAPTGTPIKAAGNGKVAFAGIKGGYGRTVVIRHGQTYKTLYAHMHRYGRGIKTGEKVKQGQTIGYVGKSGLATGPHLHYEFYKNGAVRNPVRVELPKAQPIPKSSLKDFKLKALPLVAKLERYNSTQFTLANNKQNNTNNTNN